MASKRIIEIWVKILDRAKMCIKYSKHGHYSFSHTSNCVCLGLFWPQKVYSNAQIILFLNFTSINFLVGTLQCSETLIFYLFVCIETWRNQTFKAGHFSKIAEMFSTAKNDPVCPEIWKLSFFNVYYTYLVQIFEWWGATFCRIFILWCYLQKIMVMVHKMRDRK